MTTKKEVIKAYEAAEKKTDFYNSEFYTNLDKELQAALRKYVKEKKIEKDLQGSTSDRIRAIARKNGIVGCGKSRLLEFASQILIEKYKTDEGLFDIGKFAADFKSFKGSEDLEPVDLKNII